jgi:hypothetical protein
MGTSYILKQQWWCLSVRPSVLQDGQGRGRAGAVTLAFPSRYLLAAQGRGRAGQGDPQFLETWSLHSGFPRPKKTWEILGYGFQDLGSQLWGLGNFRIWFSGHGFQDVRSQFWDLDFTQCPKVMGTHGGLHSGLRPRAPTSVLRKLQLQRYRSGEHTCITICSNSMTRSKKGPKLKTGEGAQIVKCASLGCLNIQLG